MRNTLPRALCLAAGMLLSGAIGGFAATTFTLTSVGPTNLGGVYTSPYTATISGVTNVPVAVICDDFYDDVWAGESWNVTQTSLASLPLTGSSSPVLWDNGNPTQQVTDYITAALLTEQFLTMSPSTNDAKLLSYAIWNVFDPEASSVLGTATSNTVVNSYLLPAQNQAKALVTSSATLADATAGFSNVMIYTADTKSGASVTYCPPGKTCGAPQEFLVVSMAEPASPVLLIVDLLAVISLVCFFRARQRKVSVN